MARTDEQWRTAWKSPIERGKRRTEAQRTSRPSPWPLGSRRRLGRTPASRATARWWCRSSRDRWPRSRRRRHGGAARLEPARSSTSLRFSEERSMKIVRTMRSWIGHVTAHVIEPSRGGECSLCEHCLSFRPSGFTQRKSIQPKVEDEEAKRRRGVG